MRMETRMNTLQCTYGTYMFLLLNLKRIQNTGELRKPLVTVWKGIFLERSGAARY